MLVGESRRVPGGFQCFYSVTQRVCPWKEQWRSGGTSHTGGVQRAAMITHLKPCLPADAMTSRPFDWLAMVSVSHYEHTQTHHLFTVHTEAHTLMDDLCLAHKHIMSDKDTKSIQSENIFIHSNIHSP